jgi:DNA primase
MISKDTIALVRERSDIVAVIGESVPTLKKRGRKFIGLCPFHKEKTPSFNVNPDAGVYHCFGCKESGDVITFLERSEGYSFAEAVRMLAERAGVAIEEERGAAPAEAERRRKDRDVLYGIMQMAATWYERQLAEHPQRTFAVDELARRGLTPQDPAVQAFRVGYAPAGWDELGAFLKKQGVSPALAESVGLVVPRSSGSGYYDRFRHRLMFAVADTQGRVVAFSGRALAALPDDDAGHDARRDPPPKYINSPESPIYVKGAALFGLWQARHAIRQNEHAILVEGNFDVVSLHARGVDTAIAPLGTAFTVDQAKLLHRYAPSVTLLFDGDNAGRKAARAAEEPAEAAGLDARVAVLPGGTDPDEFVRTKGPEALQHVLGQARGLFEYLIDVEFDVPFNPQDARACAQRTDRVAAIIARQHDPVARGLLKSRADYAAGRLDLVRSGPDAFAALHRKFALAARASRVDFGPRPSEARVRARRPGTEERRAIVGAILDFPSLLVESATQGDVELLEGESARIVAAIAKCLRVTARGENAMDTAEFLAQMPPSIQAFASARLASPEHETLEEARATLTANARKLRGTNVAVEASANVQEQKRVAGDWEAEQEVASRTLAAVRERHGLSRR